LTGSAARAYAAMGASSYSQGVNGGRPLGDNSRREDFVALLGFSVTYIDQCFCIRSAGSFLHRAHIRYQ